MELSNPRPKEPQYSALPPQFHQGFQHSQQPQQPTAVFVHPYDPRHSQVPSQQPPNISQTSQHPLAIQFLNQPQMNQEGNDFAADISKQSIRFWNRAVLISCILCILPAIVRIGIDLTNLQYSPLVWFDLLNSLVGALIFAYGIKSSRKTNVNQARRFFIFYSCFLVFWLVCFTALLVILLIILANSTPSKGNEDSGLIIICGISIFLAMIALIGFFIGFIAYKAYTSKKTLKESESSRFVVQPGQPIPLVYTPNVYGYIQP